MEAPIAGVGHLRLHEQRVIESQLIAAEVVAGRRQSLRLPEPARELVDGSTAAGITHVRVPVLERPLDELTGVIEAGGYIVGRLPAPVGRLVEALDRDDGGLRYLPVEVVLADRNHRRVVRQLDPAVRTRLAAEHHLELVPRADAELGGSHLVARPPVRHVHEADAHGEDEVFAAVHLSPYPVTERRVDAGVLVDVVDVGATPLRHQVVVSLEVRPIRVVVTHRPTEERDHLVGEVGIAVSPIERVGGIVVVEESLTEAGESVAECPPSVGIRRGKQALATIGGHAPRGQRVRRQRAVRSRAAPRGRPRRAWPPPMPISLHSERLTSSSLST